MKVILKSHLRQAGDAFMAATMLEREIREPDEPVPRAVVPPAPTAGMKPRPSLLRCGYHSFQSATGSCS